MNGRVEREGLCFSEDSHLADLFREAELRRWEAWKNGMQVLGAWLGLFAVAGILWVGVLKAIGAW